MQYTLGKRVFPFVWLAFMQIIMNSVDIKLCSNKVDLTAWNFCPSSPSVKILKDHLCRK